MARLRAGNVRRGSGAVRRPPRTIRATPATRPISGFALGRAGPPRGGGGAPARRDRQGPAPRLRVGEPGRDASGRSDALGAPRRDHRVSSTRGSTRSRKIASGASTWCSGSPTSSARSAGPPPRAPGSSRCSPRRRPAAVPRPAEARARSAGQRSRSTIAPHALDDWPRPEIARPTPPRRAAAARALDTGHADDALAIAEPLVQRYPSWPRALRAARPRPRGAPAASTRPPAIWRSPSTSPRPTRWPGGRSADAGRARRRARG